jgi:hypothetical protein
MIIPEIIFLRERGSGRIFGFELRYALREVLMGAARRRGSRLTFDRHFAAAGFEVMPKG